MKCDVVAKKHLSCNIQEALVDAQSSTNVGREHQCTRHSDNSMVGVNWWYVPAAQVSRVPKKPTADHTQSKEDKGM